MGEVVNVLVAFAVIVFIFRWVTSSTLTLHSLETRSLCLTQVVLNQAVNLQNNDQQRTLWALDQRMWRKKWWVLSFLLFFSDCMRKIRLTTPPDEDLFLWCKWLILKFFFCRLTQYPICFQTFLRNYLILVGRGRISLGYFTIICSLF